MKSPVTDETTVDHFLEMTTAGIPWAFARFDDGEMGLIMQTNSEASRGHQRASKGLRQALVDALRADLDRYYVGLPNPRYVKERKRALRMLPRDHPRLVESPSITHHWRKWIVKFPIAAEGRTIVWIVGEAMVAGLVNLPLPSHRIISVPMKNAWEFWRRLAPDQVPKSLWPESIVLLSCGPLARVLAAQFFKSRPDCTFIDVGTIYDPWTRGLKRKFHRKF